MPGLSRSCAPPAPKWVSTVCLRHGRPRRAPSWPGVPAAVPGPLRALVPCSALFLRRAAPECPRPDRVRQRSFPRARLLPARLASPTPTAAPIEQAPVRHWHAPACASPAPVCGFFQCLVRGRDRFVGLRGNVRLRCGGGYRLGFFAGRFGWTRFDLMCGAFRRHLLSPSGKLAATARCLRCRAAARLPAPEEIPRGAARELFIA